MLTFVGKHESDGIEAVHAVVETGATIHADEASHWDVLHARYEAYRINHSEAYSLNGACTNMAESFFSRLRRAEVGPPHHIAGPSPASYSAASARRADNRRPSTGAPAGLGL